MKQLRPGLDARLWYGECRDCGAVYVAEEKELARVAPDCAPVALCVSPGCTELRGNGSLAGRVIMWSVRSEEGKKIWDKYSRTLYDYYGNESFAVPDNANRP